MLTRMMPLIVAGMVLTATGVRAQTPFPAPLPSQAAPSAFPAPLPGQTAAPPPNASPFPPPNAAATPFPPAPRGAPAFSGGGGSPFGGAMAPAPMGQQAGPPPGYEDCVKRFLPLRQDAEAKANLIKAASQRKAPPDEACKLIKNFSGAEIKMINFMESNGKKCGIPSEISKQLLVGHQNTEKMKTRVCDVAAHRGQGAAPPPSLSEALGASAAIPESDTKKRGGATFDSLTGNALAR